MNNLKRFLPYYRPYTKLFALDMLCALAVSACDLFYPVITKNIINEYVPDRNVRLLVVWSAVLLGIYLVKMCLNYIIQFWGHVMGVGIQGDMRHDMFCHLQRLPFSFFDNNKTGTLMSRMINDLMDISELAHHCPEDLFISLIMLIGSFVILVGINLYLTLIIFAVLPLIILFALKMRTKMHSAFKESRVRTGEINAGVENALSGVRVTRAYGATDYEKDRFDTKNTAFKNARKRAYKSMAQFFSGMNLLTDMLYLVILFAGGLFFYYGKIDIGEFVAYLLYVTMFLKPVNRLVSFFEQFQDGLTGLNRFIEIMDEKPQEDNGVYHGSLSGNIVFDRVGFSYSAGEDGSAKVIDSLSMTIPAKSTVALVGPSGGGKTTICNLIPRFYEIISGSISIDGHDVKDIRLSTLRENIGIVAQDVFLFDGTVRENILYGKPDATDIELEQAAKKAGIHDFIMTLPEKYDTEVGERGVKLSGGQKQRVSIARVFLRNPPILILDEATSALDNASEMMIQKSLDMLSRGRTVIVVAHRLSTVRRADEIIVITGDGIAERGTHDALLASDGLYAELYKYQFT